MSNQVNGRSALVGVREARVAATRSSILDAAERLFAEQGVMSVSNRQISDAAGQGNNTAVSYHFGTKVDLVRAIVQRHQIDIDARRDRIVAETVGSDSVRDWVRCLVQPTAEHFAELVHRGHETYYARFSAQVLADPELRTIVTTNIDSMPSLRLALENLDRCRPELPPVVYAERENMSRQLISWGYAGREMAIASQANGVDWNAYATILVDAVTGLWLAPWTPLQ
ncbi:MULTISPECIES: TetR/AcrR family transcriptional regulator [unclassified Frondihabitans]|uniref:TetR/AcrR family transcriptional regulator n=1 Tax=unclassified Frondihabitans TaxID=2626248 RepID=UPI000F4F8772|nr:MULTISPECIES: TetR/AcrR family transcriptional regulator [unclassified Frondihabitans]RPE77852.1 TetR family transcriptional regulator [Frondihabitans sp. PhB153]RPF08131.1 TetR family transcriptional regulator [Frondihabitans sp. PhB161]